MSERLCDYPPPSPPDRISSTENGWVEIYRFIVISETLISSTWSFLWWHYKEVMYCLQIWIHIDVMVILRDGSMLLHSHDGHESGLCDWHCKMNHTAYLNPENLFGDWITEKWWVQFYHNCFSFKVRMSSMKEFMWMCLEKLKIVTCKPGLQV